MQHKVCEDFPLAGIRTVHPFLKESKSSHKTRPNGCTANRKVLGHYHPLYHTVLLVRGNQPVRVHLLLLFYYISNENCIVGVIF